MALMPKSMVSTSTPTDSAISPQDLAKVPVESTSPVSPSSMLLTSAASHAACPCAQRQQRVGGVGWGRRRETLTLPM